jgi:uncharacterized phage protein gp47/JayE
VTTSYGVTSWGFLRKPLSQIVADVQDQLRLAFGQNVDLSEDGPYGQLVAALAQLVDDAWQVTEAVYDSFDPDAADGPRLVSICGITGTVPKTPTQSTVIGTAIGTAGSVVKAGTQVQVQNSGPLFATTAPATIAALPARAPSAPLAQDTLVVNGGNVYRAMNTGVTGAGGGPAGQGTAIADGSVIFRWLGAGTAAVDVPCASVLYGALAALAGTLNVIATPVAGLASFTNARDAVQGVAIETDTQLRLRREQELRAEGQGGVDSIRASILKLVGVSDAFVLENTGDAVDGNGLPSHSLEAVVLTPSISAALDAAIAAAVFTRGAGIGTHGGVANTVLDAVGDPHTVYFSRPTEVDVWVVVHVTKETNPSLPAYPSNGDALVAQALVDFAAGNTPDLWRGYHVGDPVVTSKLYRPIEAVPGVFDVTAIYIGTAPGPGGSANVVTGVRGLAKFDSSRIVVVST